MYMLLEYLVSTSVWVFFFVIIFFVSKKTIVGFTQKLTFFDFLLSAIFTNAFFYLINIKASDYLTYKFDEMRYLSNEGWAIVWVEIFFDKIINWILLLMMPLMIIFKHRT